MSTQNAIATVEMPGTPQARQAITPMQMLQIAVEQNADLDKLSKLMDLQERWEANEARKAYVSALNAFKADPPTVVKNKRAGFDSKKTGDRTEYEYATLDAVSAIISASLSEHGLSHRWEVQQLDGGAIRVTCILTHEMGHSERASLQAGADQSGSKNNIQAIGSTVTYLERYTLLAITGLAAKGQDNDTAGLMMPRITESQALDLEALAIEVKADKPKLLRYLKIESFADLPAGRFEEAVAALERKRGGK